MRFNRRLAIALGLGLMLAGCGKPPATPAANLAKSADAVKKAPSADSKKLTIGFSALTLTNPFFKVIADAMTAEAAKHGYEVVVVTGERDVKKQADQVNEFIVRGVDAIVLNPCDSQSIGPAIEKANQAGIPVFTNDIKYDGKQGKVVCHVATDNYQGGKLAGDAMVKLLGESGGKVAILHFPKPNLANCESKVSTKSLRHIILNRTRLKSSSPRRSTAEQSETRGSLPLKTHSRLIPISLPFSQSTTLRPLAPGPLSTRPGKRTK